jgi:hypothetical protein
MDSVFKYFNAIWFKVGSSGGSSRIHQELPKVVVKERVSNVIERLGRARETTRSEPGSGKEPLIY